MKTFFLVCEISLKIFFVIVIYMLSCFGKARMFSKAGEPAWQAWIPFYRMYVLNKIILGSGWFFICFYIPVAGIFAGILLALDAARAYRHGEEKGFISLLYLVFPWAAQYVLGFGPAVYEKACDVPQQLKYFFSGFDQEASRISWTLESDAQEAAGSVASEDGAAAPAGAAEKTGDVPEEEQKTPAVSAEEQMTPAVSEEEQKTPAVPEEEQKTSAVSEEAPETAEQSPAQESGQGAE